MCNIFIEEEHITGYYQNDTRISVHSGTRDTQGVESGNHVGWPRI